MVSNARRLSKAKCSEYHRQVGDDFRALANIAQRHNFFDWVSDLHTIGVRLSKNDSERWNYSLSSVSFDLPPASASWPTASASLSCHLSLDVSGTLEFDPTENEIVSRIEAWQGNLTFEAVDAGSNRWYQFWHFDRHPGGDPPPEVHPLYHANFGGARLEKCRVENNDELFKGLIEMAAPRLHVPPMDAVLFIDFIIANFDGEKWSKARSDPGYVHLVAKAQSRSWRSYFRTLSDFFSQPSAKRVAHGALELWPNLAVTPV